MFKYRKEDQQHQDNRIHWVQIRVHSFPKQINLLHNFSIDMAEVIGSMIVEADEAGTLSPDEISILENVALADLNNPGN